MAVNATAAALYHVALSNVALKPTSDLWKLASLAFYLTRSQLSWSVR